MDNTWKGLFPKATLNLVDGLIDGVETFKSYVDAIETAKNSEHYIYIAGWMLDVDFPLTGTPTHKSLKKGFTYFSGTKNLINLLKIATGNDVQVRILIWNNPFYTKKNNNTLKALNQLPHTKAFIDDYTFTGNKSKMSIGAIEPLIRDLIRRFGKYFTNPAARIEELYNISPKEVLSQIDYYLKKKNVGSHHEKILIVKGEKGLISFCGGLDINQNRFTSYHDTACKVCGPEAHEILTTFIKRWETHTEANIYSLKGKADTIPLPLKEGVKNALFAHKVGTYNSPNGKNRDRSLKDSYLKIIAKARNYIYIGDQYLVNLDIAEALNKKIHEPFFKQLIVIIQDSRETTDIMIPDRKRGEFYHTVLKNASATQKRKFSLFMINDDKARSAKFHPGMHAKTLIVDDEIAIIGSANVNQRSFTLDSETSLIVFNKKDTNYRQNFAYKLRQRIFDEFTIHKTIFSQITWEEFARNVKANDRFYKVRFYVNSIEDLDKRIIAKIKPNALVMSYGLSKLYKRNLHTAVKAISILNSPVAIKQVFDVIWDTIIDPEVI